jgi:hypothetical protein
VSARLVPAPVEPTERQFQSAIERALEREGYRFMHVRTTKTPDGRWLTGTSSPGFPDVLALRPGWVLAIEVKARTGKVTPVQIAWLTAFRDAGALAWVTRPTDDLLMLARWIAAPETAPETFGWVP